MKKFFRTTAMMLALSMMLGISAMAAPTVNNVEGQDASYVDVQDNKIGSVTYENNKIVEGGQYMIFVSTADIPTQNSLLYINQEEAKTDGEVTFNNVYPKQMRNSKVLVSGTGLGGLQHILDILAQLLLGYIDNDDVISAADAQEILRFAVGLSSFIETENLSAWLPKADVDGDEVVTAADAQEILRFSVGLSSMLDSVYGE